MKLLKGVASRATVAAFVATSLSGVALAQSSGGSPGLGSESLEEVTVTARKREEKLLDIPLSVTVLGAEEIQKAQIFDLRDVAKLAPGAYIQTVGGNGAGRYIPSFIFRGLTSANPLPRIQTGAVFVDGIFVLGGVNAVNTVDVQRVEVLKGPQNAHFGRNTFGGAINFITRNPGTEPAGDFNVMASERGSYDVNLSAEGGLFSGLLEDKLTGRLSLLTHKKAAHYLARDGGKLGEENTDSIAATLYYKPSENAWVRFRGYYQQDDDTHGPLAHLSGPLNGGSSCAGKTFTGFDAVTRAPRTYSLSIPYICSIPTVDQVGAGIISVNTNLLSPRLASLGNPNGLVNTMVNNGLGDPLIARVPHLDHMGLARHVQRFSLQGEYTFANNWTLAANAGYDDTRTMAIFDADRSNEENVYGAMPALSLTKSYELRLSSNPEKRFRWMFGGNYYEGKFESSFGGGGSVLYQVRTSPLQPIATAPLRVATTPGTISTNGEVAKVSAFFGSVEFDITDKLTIEAEARRQTDEGVLTSAPAIKAKFSDTLPRLILSYKPDPNWTLYVSGSKGVLPGTFNAQYATASGFHRGLIEAAFPGVADVADSDELTSYEIGSKQSLFEGRLQYTLAIYKMDWKNLKATSAFVVPTTAGSLATTTFTGIIVPGDAELKGVELETTAVITDNWDVNLKGNWQHGEYTNFINPFLAQLTSNVTRFDGNELPRVPDVTVSLASTYRHKINDDWRWYLRGDAIYTGRGWDSEANIVQNDPFTRVNARIGFEKENLSIELYATNLFDNRDWAYIFRNVYQGSAGAIFTALPPGFGFPAFGFPQGIVVGVPDKRDFGLRMSYKF